MASTASAPQIRKNTVPSTAPFFDGTGNGNVTIGRSTLFGKLFMQVPGSKPLEVGGMQAFSVEETNDTQLRSMAGSDWQEPVFGARRWSGSFSRFQIRGNDFQEMLSQVYPGTGDPDFRFCPFIWQYQFQYQGPSGAPLIDNASWNWMTIFVTSYRVSFADPFSLIMEDGNFIGKGYHRTDGAGKFKLASAQTLWGAGGFAGSGQQTNASPSASPINAASGPASGGAGAVAQVGAAASQFYIPFTQSPSNAMDGVTGYVTPSQQGRDVRG